MKAIEKYSCFLLLFLILFYGVTKNEKQTTLQKLLFCDNMQHYKIVEGIHSNVYYQKEKEYAELIQRQADTYYAMIAEDFKWNKTDKINFILFYYMILELLLYIVLYTFYLFLIILLVTQILSFLY